MDNDGSAQQKMSRFASPLIGERSPKRSRKSLEPEEMEATKTIEVIADGDALLVVSGLSSSLEAPVGLRVSSFAMSMASPVLKTQIATAAHQREEEPKIILPLPNDDGDAVLVLCNIVHLQNHKLPSRMSAELLLKIALLAETYACTVAVGRSTTQWFDDLYHRSKSDSADLCKIVEAAFLLDEASWFARFSSEWVLTSSIFKTQVPVMSASETQKLALMLLSQQASSSTRLRMDLDTLVNIAVRCFSYDYKHYIDFAPEMSPEPSETPSGKPPVRCRVDGDGGQEFLGALREAHIWPSDVWHNGVGVMKVSIKTVVDRLADFILPDYDDADRCEFCDGINNEFAAGLKRLKQDQKERLWGLCLDCFKAGGVNKGECRFQHPNRAEAITQTPQKIEAHALVQPSAPGRVDVPQAPLERGGLGIEGL